MKNKIFTNAMIVLFLLLNIEISFAQWQTHGPFGGALNALTTSGGNVFVGTGDGVFKSADNGSSWTAANTGIDRKVTSALSSRGSSIFAGVYNDGVYLSTNNGASWTLKNIGLSNFYISALFAADTGLYAATGDGVFYSADDGNSWTLANSGIPSTYAVYAFAQMGDTIYSGTYGMGLYRSNNHGITWTNVGGVPSGAFIYGLLNFGNTIIAGTSAGVYKSADRGVTWVSSNTGFPPSMWAKSFAVKPGYIFAGTYSEGVFVSTDNGNSWTAMNTGIPDLPIATGLPHNYPSVEALIISGPNVLAATSYGIFLSGNNGTSWAESCSGILGNTTTAIAANSNYLFAGNDRTGVYASADNGMTWTHSNTGLTSFDVLALGVKGTSVFAGLLNDKVFRSDNNGASWVHADSGLTSDVWILQADSSRMLAVTTGAMYTPRGLFQTIDNGMHWTEIPTSFATDITCIASAPTKIYAGTTTGIIHYTSDNGATWSTINTGLSSSIQINTILIDGSNLFIGTQGMGVYKSTDNGATWAAVNTGIGYNVINDIKKNNSVLEAASWGGGVYMSSNEGASWYANNTGLTDMYVKNLANRGVNIYAGTDAGVYSSTLSVSAVAEYKPESGINVFPNPASTSIFFTLPSDQKINVSINDMQGRLVYKYMGISAAVEKIDVSSYSKGIYFLEIQTEKEIFKKKIIVQ
ncbi:MAG: T9SS type A sorting domain-containing protein [Bacteroidia bacterium]